MKRGRGYNKMGHLDKIFLVSLHSLCNIKITKSFHYEPRFNVFCFFSRDNLPRKTRWSVCRVSKEKHWVSLFIDKNTAVYFDSFGNEYIPQEVLHKIKDKSINHNIFRIQSNDLIMCGFYCTTFDI